MKFTQIKKRRFKSMAAIVAAGMFLAACGGGNEAEEAAYVPVEPPTQEVAPEEPAGPEEVTLRIGWWGGDNRHGRTIEVIDMFMEEFPHITIEYDFASWDDYWAALNVQAAGGNLPDIIQMDGTRITEFADNNLIISLNDLIASGAIDLSDVDPAFQEAVQIDGQNMAISLGANGFAMVYNRELAAELGFEFTPELTWDQWEEFLTATRAERGDDFYGWGMGAEYEIFQVYVRDAGESMYGPGGLGFEKETLVDFFEMLSRKNDNSIIVTPERGEGVEGRELLHNEVILSEMFASNQIISAQSEVEAELGLALLPRIDGGRGGNWLRSSMGFSITTHSQEQEAAAKFIDFFTNSLAANEILEAERGAPISTAVRDHLSGIVDPVVVKTFDILPVITANASPADALPPAGQSEVRLAFLRAVEQLRFGVATPEQAADYVISAAGSALN